MSQGHFVRKYYFRCIKSLGMRHLFIFLLTFQFSFLMAQQTPLPFSSIPPAPETVNAANTLVRMVQGLGYRYHWASRDLRPEDLAYRPSAEAASCLETLQHIYGLADAIANATKALPSPRPLKGVPNDLTELRQLTLERLKLAETTLLAADDADVEQMEVIFQRGEKAVTFALWNLINGPISDAIYHTGQVVSFRRTTGNPIHPGVNVLVGKTKM